MQEHERTISERKITCISYPTSSFQTVPWSIHPVSNNLQLDSKNLSSSNLQPKRTRFLHNLLILLALSFFLLFSLARHLFFKLVWSPIGDILRPIIAKAPLQAFFDNPARAKVQHHHARNHPLELACKRHELETRIELRDEFGSAGEGDEGHGDEAPVHALIFADGFAEGAALVVDCEGGDLLDELEEVDGGVEEGGLKFLLEVWVRVFGLDALDVLGYVDKGRDVDGELP
jgi:hypothetical protein